MTGAEEILHALERLHRSSPSLSIGEAVVALKRELEAAWARDVAALSRPLGEHEDACDVCLLERYPGKIPEQGSAPLADGWNTVIHPFPSMHPPDNHGVSLCCPTCSEAVRIALGYYDDGGRTRGLMYILPREKRR